LVNVAEKASLDGKYPNFFFGDLQKLQQRAKNVLSFVGSMLNKSRDWSLYLVSFLVGLTTYQHPLVVADYNL
jgi:hypothetical protein